MNNQEEYQGDTGRDFNNNNENFEIDQGQDQFQQNSNQISPQENIQNPIDDNSFHLSNKIDSMFQNENFNQKVNGISQQLENIFNDKLGYNLSKLNGKYFTINKILLLTTLTEFLFQRFDIVTLFLCMGIILIELEIFTQKHLYKWLIVLFSSLLLDALVLLDIAPVSQNIFFIFQKKFFLI